MLWLGYTRVSRVGDRAETLISPELQAERITQYANGRGLEVEMLEPELDVSGGRVARPILGAALERVESGEAAGIIVAQLDRLSRMDIADALATIRRIEESGGKVIAVAENFDADTPEGRMARNVLLALGEMQLDRYKAQFAAAKESAVERGVWPHPRIPQGYRRGEDRRLVPGPDAEKVVRAFEARAAGESWARVGQILGRSPLGARHVIQNRVYLGEVKVAPHINPDAHPAIVSRDIWEAAQIPHPRPPRSSAPALLMGLVRCAGCQRTMSASGDVYRCSRHRAGGTCQTPARIGRKSLEAHVEAVVLPHVESTGAVMREATDLGDEAMERLREAEGELEAFQGATRASEVGGEFFAAGLRARVREVEAARAEVGRVRAAKPNLPEIENIREVWPELSVEERSHLLRSFLGVVWVKKGMGTERVRVIAVGFEPPNLSTRGHFAGKPVPLRWPRGDFDGEIRIPGSEDTG